MKTLTKILLTLGMASLVAEPTIKTSSYTNYNSPKQIPISYGKEEQKISTFNDYINQEVQIAERKRLSKPRYLPQDEIKSIINLLYSKISPKYLTKEQFERVGFYESNHNVHAFRNDTKVKGWYQLKKETYEEFEKKVPYEKGAFIPELNAKIALEHFYNLETANKKLNPNWKNSTNLEKTKYLLAAHNWGIGWMKEVNWDLNRMPKETKNFIKKVLSKN